MTGPEIGMIVIVSVAYLAGYWIGKKIGYREGAESVHYDWKSTQPSPQQKENL